MAGMFMVKLQTTVVRLWPEKIFLGLHAICEFFFIDKTVKELRNYTSQQNLSASNDKKKTWKITLLITYFVWTGCELKSKNVSKNI